MDLHETLKIVKLRVETSTVKPYNSICAALDQLELDAYGRTASSNTEGTVAHQLKTLFERWPKYSGTETYPVPSPDSTRSADSMFYYALDMDGMWTGPYGNLRKELLDFLIQETQP